MCQTLEKRGGETEAEHRVGTGSSSLGAACLSKAFNLPQESPACEEQPLGVIKGRAVWGSTGCGALSEEGRPDRAHEERGREAEKRQHQSLSGHGAFQNAL